MDRLIPEKDHGIYSPSNLSASFDYYETISGWIIVIWGDGAPGSKVAVEKYLLIDKKGTYTQVEFPDYLVKSVGGILTLNGKFVFLRGTMLDDKGINGEQQIFRANSIYVNENETPLFPEPTEAVIGTKS
jgi:hypothetical protein